MTSLIAIKIFAPLISHNGEYRVLKATRKRRNNFMQSVAILFKRVKVLVNMQIPSFSSMFTIQQIDSREFYLQK